MTRSDVLVLSEVKQPGPERGSLLPWRGVPSAWSFEGRDLMVITNATMGGELEVSRSKVLGQRELWVACHSLLAWIVGTLGVLPLWY